MTNPTPILTVSATIDLPVQKVWAYWTLPGQMKKWNNASSDWHTPHAENDLKTGGKFLSRMESVDGKMGFDFKGTYLEVVENKHISYLMEDGRKVEITFKENGDSTDLIESFEAETENSLDLKQQGWQSILDNFKTYSESYTKMEKMYFEILFKAALGREYQLMFEDESYSVWTSEFSAGSYFKGSWKKGSKILFIGRGRMEKWGWLAVLKRIFLRNLPQFSTWD